MEARYVCNQIEVKITQDQEVRDFIKNKVTTLSVKKRINKKTQANEPVDPKPLETVNNYASAKDEPEGDKIGTNQPDNEKHAEEKKLYMDAMSEITKNLSAKFNDLETKLDRHEAKIDVIKSKANNSAAEKAKNIWNDILD